MLMICVLMDLINHIRIQLVSKLFDLVFRIGFISKISFIIALVSTYGHGCHFYCKIKDIDRAATLLAQNNQVVPIRLQQQTPLKLPVRYLFVCKVLVGRYTRGDSSMKTCPSGYESLVDNPSSPEVFVPSHDAQVLPEYLITYQSDIF